MKYELRHNKMTEIKKKTNLPLRHNGWPCQNIRSEQRTKFSQASKQEK